MDDKTYFPHRRRPFERADKLLLLRREIQGGKFRQDSDAVIELDHPAQCFQAAGLVVEMTPLFAGLSQFTKPDDLAAKAMPFLEQPQFIWVYVLGEHIGLFIGGILAGDIDQQLFVEKHLFPDAVLLKGRDEDTHIDTALAEPGDYHF